MIKKKMWRYYCEHCNKGGCSSGHMKKHETSCTANPDRICGVCSQYGLKQADTEVLVKAALESHESLSKEANGCPACILAAYRQAGIASLVNYDFKKALSEFRSSKGL